MSKTALEMFRDIKEFETPDGSEITVADIVPYFCEKIEKALQRLEAIDNAEPSEALECVDEVWLDIKVENNFRSDFKCLRTIRQYILKTQEDKRFIELILNKPQLLNVFALDGVHTWEEFEDTFSDEDKEYINTTKEEYEYMRNQLIKRGKIDE